MRDPPATALKSPHRTHAPKETTDSGHNRGADREAYPQRQLIHCVSTSHEKKSHIHSRLLRKITMTSQDGISLQKREWANACAMGHTRSRGMLFLSTYR